MKAILVDPFARTVEQVNYSGNYADIYPLIGAQTFDAVRIKPDENGDALFIDDEGPLMDEGQAFFSVAGVPNPIAGKALLLGCDEDGETVEAVTQLEELRELVAWISELDARTRIAENSRATAAAARAMGMSVEDCGNGVLFISR